MQGKGHGIEPSKSLGHMPATDDEIQEKYLERAGDLVVVGDRDRSQAAALRGVQQHVDRRRAVR